MPSAERVKSAFGVHTLNTGQMRELQFICNSFNLTRQQAGRLCRCLRIPLIYIGKGQFFSQWTFERTLFFLLRWGGKGFAAPGSDKKNKGAGDIPTQITDDFIASCSTPESLVEIYLAGGKRDKAGDVLAGLIKKLGLKKEKVDEDSHSGQPDIPKL